MAVATGDLLDFDPCAPTAAPAPAASPGAAATPATASVAAVVPEVATLTPAPVTSTGFVATVAPQAATVAAPHAMAGDPLSSLAAPSPGLGANDLSVLMPAQPTTQTATNIAPQPAPAANSAGGFDFGEWDDFQSSVPTAAAATAQTASAAPTAPAPALVAPTIAPAAMVFDPMLDDFSGNLISCGDADNFDPLAPIKEPPAVTAVVAPSPAPAPAASAPAEEVVVDGDDLLGLGGTPAPKAAVKASTEETEVVPEGVEDIEKKIIYVYHKGEKNIVAWYADTKPADIKEAILCACDAIMDGGFVLKEVQFTGDDDGSAEAKEDGTVYDYETFDQLGHEQTYVLEAAKEREDLKSITGDRYRRLKVLIEPMLHVEAQKAIERMRRGSNLLKHTHYGFPHLRQFQLSDDRKRLVWYTGAKRKEDSLINLDELVEIRLGQTTPVFLNYRLPMLEHLSFSLVYGSKGSKTLDLTCKDEFEFDHWVTGLKAIFYHFKNRQISKEQLLGHSKRFRKALEKNNVGIKLTKLPEVKEKGHVGLDDCIEIVTHTPAQLDTKMERLRERLRTMSQQVARLDHHAAAEMEVDFALLTGQGPAYASVFVQDEDAQDEEMEIRRMHELVEQTTQILQQARNELAALNQSQRSSAGEQSNDASSGAKGKKKESAACKHIDQLLWKAEVDLENVEDMYLRHLDNQKDTASPFSFSLTRASSDVSEMFSNKLDEMRSWFG